MARYWVPGGNGNTNSTTNWSDQSGGSSGFSLPTSSDDVFIDGNSGTGTVNIPQDTTLDCRDLTIADAFTGSINWAGGGLGHFANLAIFGSFYIGTGITALSGSGSRATRMKATDAGHTIRTNGKQLPTPLYIEGAGGGWQLQDDLTLTATSTFSLVRGTLDLNDCDVATDGVFMADSGTDTRALYLRSGTVTCGGWQIADATGMTLDAGASTILVNFPTGDTTDRIFRGGGLTYHDVRRTGTGNGVWLIYQSNTFNVLGDDSPPPNTTRFENGTTQTIADLDFIGTDGNLLTLKSSIDDSTWYLYKAPGTPIILDYVSLQDSHAAGAVFFTGSHSTNVSGNDGWTWDDYFNSIVVAELIPDIIQIATALGPPGFMADQEVVTVFQTATAINYAPRNFAASQQVPPFHPVLFSVDTFTDTSGTLLTSSTPDLGPSWEVTDETAPEWTIQSNQLSKLTGNNAHAWVDIGDSNMSVSANFTHMEGLCALLVRRQNANNYWELLYNWGVGWQLDKVINGVDNWIGINLPGSIGRVTLTARGNTITATGPDGTTVTADDLVLHNETRAGLILNGFGEVASTVDDWRVTRHPNPLGIGETADVDVVLGSSQTIPAFVSVATLEREAVAQAIQQISTIGSFDEAEVEVSAEAPSQSIPSIANSGIVVTEIGFDHIKVIPDVLTEAYAVADVEARVDQAVPPAGFSGNFNHESLGAANQDVPSLGQIATLIKSWDPIIPYHWGSKLLYRHATPLEKVLADVESERLFDINAEAIIENWDPYKVLTRNIPFLAFGMGVTLWEDGYWSEGAKRSWIADQWTYKSLRGTIAGIRMALSVSGYELKSYINPPQGFYASPSLSSENFNRWIRLMPELRFTYAPKHGTAFVGEFFSDYGFSDDGIVGLRDGYALRGRYAFLRQNGVETPLSIIEYHQTEEVRESVTFERVSLPGKSTMGFFSDESAAGEDNFVGSAESDPKMYTVRIDQERDVSVTNVQLTTLIPAMDPMTPSFEVNSDVGDGGVWFFAGDFCDDERFADREDGGDRLLAQRMYLLDPIVAAPMTLGSSFANVDRVGLPTFTAELMVDLKTSEDLPSIFASDAFAGASFAVPENTEHVDRALRAIVDAKALRDTMLVSFAPRRLVEMGDYLTDDTTASTYVPNTL